MAKLKQIYYPPLHGPRSCKVTVQDSERLEHTVTVTVSSVYEAVALAIAPVRTDEWTTGLLRGLVCVTATTVPVEHTVKLEEFTEWLQRDAASPRERVREILGLSPEPHNPS